MTGPPVVKPYQRCSKAEIEAFCRLVIDGGQVKAEYVKRGVPRAKHLVFMHDGQELVGTAAIKTPSTRYKKGVFTKAQQPDMQEDFQLELGYVVVEKQHRGQGLSRTLVEAALKGYETTPVFATSRTERIEMHKTLQRFAFVRVGQAYQAEDEDAKVFLFVRRPSTTRARIDAGAP